jgi:hypothetical protein
MPAERTHAPAKGTRGAGQHALFDDVIGSDQYRWRNREPEPLSRLHIDDQVKPCWLFHW